VRDVPVADPREPDPREQLDLAALEPRWRTAVEEALESQNRFRSLVQRSSPGPLRDRLEEIGGPCRPRRPGRLGNRDRAQAGSQTVRAMHLERVTDRLKDARRRVDPGCGRRGGHQTPADRGGPPPEQHGALNDLANGVDEGAVRLRMLDLRLDASVARAAQIVLRPDALQQLGLVDEELRMVVEQRSALQTGLDALPGD
jgi:hypothetical protein